MMAGSATGLVPFRLGAARIAGQGMALIELDGVIRRADDFVRPFLPHAPLQGLVGGWDHRFPELARRVAAGELDTAPAVDAAAIEWLPPVVAPSKLICIGTNYRDHVAEMGVPQLPQFPYAFLRPPGSLNAHGAEVAMPAQSRMVDWEAELGVVIGRRVRDVRGAAALEAVAAYAVVNDISARDWIDDRPAFVGIDWVMQKGWDGFQPTGPWLTPAAFIPDPQNLAIRCEVNGVVKQDSSTAQMIFGVQAVVEHLSAIMTLEPGDIIATGTPAGVGFGRKPREFLADGDVVRVTIEGLGTLENTMRARAASQVSPDRTKAA